MISGFKKQWAFTGTCSRHALRHAVLCLGYAPSEKELSVVMRRSHFRTAIFGSDENGIKDGTRGLGFFYKEISYRSTKTTKIKIDKQIDNGFPVIVCCEKWDHWAVLAGKTQNRYLCIDSDKKTLIRWETWETIEPWIANYDEDKPFYALSVRPKGQALFESLVKRPSVLAKTLRDRSLAHWWGKLAMILRAVCGDGAQTLQDWLLQNQSHIRLSRKRVRQLGVVANCYRARVSKNISIDQVNQFIVAAKEEKRK